MDIKTIQTFVEELDRVTVRAIVRCGQEVNPEMKLILGNSISVWNGITEALEKIANRLTEEQNKDLAAKVKREGQNKEWDKGTFGSVL